MMRCRDCRVRVEGRWTICPLCDATLTGQPQPSPYPAVPLRFSRRRLLQILTLTSLAIILASFLAQLLFDPGRHGLGAFRSVWLGIAAMWLVVLMAVRKRRNLAKSTVYLVVLVSLVCVYWDYLSGWNAWSLNFVVPIVCGSAIIALLITVRAMRIEVGDHIVYSGLTVLLGLTPLLFLLLGWVDVALPSGICGLLSLVALGLGRRSRGRDVSHELAKRLHL